MCVVSMVGDFYGDKFKKEEWKGIFPINPGYFPPSGVTREEFEKLKKEVEEMKDLLKRAKEYDQRTSQPDCEMEDKVAILKKVAQLVGVDLTEIFKEQ